MLLQTQLLHQRRDTAGAGEGQQAAVLGSPEKPHGPSQAFVFLFEWSWPDVAKECEAWLGPKGFTAALVSPPNEHNTGEPWYMRYQPVSYNLTSRSGTEAQFADMVGRCRAVGVGIYVDAVFNHCAPMSGVGVAGSSFGFRSYPLFSPQDFHHQASDVNSNCGVSDYHDKHNVQYCDLQGMPDLCTGCAHVQDTVAAYINRMGELGIAGFRVDAAKHMDAGELGSILAKVNSSLFRFLEVTAVPGEVVQTPMYYSDGLVTEFGYAATVEPKFRGQGLLRDDFKKFGEDWGLVPSDRAVVFLDNQDTQRNGQAQVTHKSGDVYTLLSIFMLAYPYGYPKVMSSYAFTSNDQGPPGLAVHGQDGEVRCGAGQPWVCEHRLEPIANMVAWRKAAGTGALQSFYSDGDTLAFCRGESACVALNRLETSHEAEFSFSLPDGSYCDVLQAGCRAVQVQDGRALLQLPPVGAVALHVAATAPATEKVEGADDDLLEPPEVERLDPLDEAALN